jgi:hypothetical protein
MLLALLFSIYYIHKTKLLKNTKLDKIETENGVFKIKIN